MYKTQNEVLYHKLRMKQVSISICNCSQTSKVA